MQPLPPPDQMFDHDSFGRWPMGAEETALLRGHPVFYGAFTEVDVATAQRALPGRPVTLWDGEDAEDRALVVHAEACTPNGCRLWDGYPG